jgi:hypothetical protein
MLLYLKDIDIIKAMCYNIMKKHSEVLWLPGRLVGDLKF